MQGESLRREQAKSSPDEKFGVKAPPVTLPKGRRGHQLCSLLAKFAPQPIP